MTNNIFPPSKTIYQRHDNHWIAIWVSPIRFVNDVIVAHYPHINAVADQMRYDNPAGRHAQMRYW